MASIEFSNITKEYGTRFGHRHTALSEFSLKVEAGEIFGFLGPNGAGKTTAIHLALGFMRPNRGSGTLLGRPFGDASARKRVGFLAENVSFYYRTAQQVVRFSGELNGVREPLLSARTHELLHSMGLDEVAHKKISKFSRGMLQRVGLAQALVNDPDVLILDEPTSALDPLSRLRVRELLMEQRNRGKTVFLSSHLLSEVEQICDRVAILRDGRVVKVAPTHQLLLSGEEIEICVRGVSSEVFSRVCPEARIVDGGRPGSDSMCIRVGTADHRRALEQVWKLGGEIVSLNPAGHTLEEIFLDLTGDLASTPGESRQKKVQ